MSKPEPHTPEEARQTLETFIPRARRVEAHSMVKNGTAERYARYKFTLTKSQSGEEKIEKDIIPTDEEAIDSLAARIRPFIVSGEAIYLDNVFKAIELAATGPLTSEETEWFEKLREHYIARSRDKTSSVWAVQIVDKDGNPRTDYVSDARLAESWVYTDLVHASPNEKNSIGLQFGFKTRYEAAAPYFCEFALMVTSLLDLVRELSGNDILEVSEKAWTQPVTYAQAKEEGGDPIAPGSAYVMDPLPPETQLPRDTRPEDLPGARKATPEVINSLTGTPGKAELTLLNKDKQPIAKYPASWQGSANHSTFLVNDVLRIDFSKRPSSDDNRVLLDYSAVYLEEGTQRENDLASKLAAATFAEFDLAERGKLGFEIPHSTEKKPTVSS